MSRNSEDKNVCHRLLLNQHLYRTIDIVSGKARFQAGDIGLCCTKAQIYVIYRYIYCIGTGGGHL
jgi:hypothetical protein